jgi:hypothetical protein
MMLLRKENEAYRMEVRNLKDRINLLNLEVEAAVNLGAQKRPMSSSSKGME